MEVGDEHAGRDSPRDRRGGAARRRPARLRRRALAADDPGRARPGPASARRPGRGRGRSPRPDGRDRHGQTDPPGPRQRRPPGGAELPVLRRLCRARNRRVAAVVDRPPRVHQARAGRRGRGHLALELPAHAVELEGRARPGLRQHRGAQACRAVSRLLQPARPACRGGRPAAWDTQRRAGVRPRRGRAGPHRAPRRRPGHLHRGVGDPLDEATEVGPLSSLEHWRKVTGYLELAAAEGAKVRTGGQGDGWWLRPTVLVDVRQDMRICREEIFGPVVVVQPFDDDDEAVRLANDSPYGLNAMVFTESLRRAHQVAAAIRAGTVWVNCFFVRDLRAPFGGYKDSGIGREGGSYSREFFTEAKAVVMQL